MKINKKVHSKEFRNKMASNARTVNKNKKPDGFIYVLQFGNKNIFKFGTSANPDRRIKDIDSSSPVKIIELGRFYFKNAYEMEECIHENIQEFLLRKEWFKIEKSIVLEIIEELKFMSENGYYLQRI